MTSLAPVPEDWSRALAIVAHPDDLEYGSASAVAKWISQGKSIAYALATRGEAGIDGMNPMDCAPIRAQEELNSAAVVGVTEVVFFDHQDGTIEYGLPLRRDVARAVRRFRPEVIISLNRRESWGGQSWNTPDHRAVGTAAIDGARDAGNRWIFPIGWTKAWTAGEAPEWCYSTDLRNLLTFVTLPASWTRASPLCKSTQRISRDLGGGSIPTPSSGNLQKGSGKDVGCRHAVTFEMISL